MDSAPGERTALAWQRTGWTALGVGALLLHAAQGWPGAVAGVVLLAGAAACSVMAPSRVRARARAAPVVLATVTAVVVLVGVLAMTAVVAG